MLVPFRLARLDPHALFDPVASLFGHAIADPLFALDAFGRVYPALAAALPEPIPGGARVRLRPGLRSARDKPLSARDVIASLARARRQGAAPLLEALGVVRRGRGDPMAVDFVGADANAVARALSSPLLAVLPADFSPLAPDGTGAFAADFENGRLRLTRNNNAARGPAFLERIELATANDLTHALRSFESGSVDVGWLGSGLHRPRRGALAFRGVHYGWAILRLGKVAGAWGAPGVAQGLLDNLDPSRLRHLGLQALSDGRGGARWGGGPAEVQVLKDAPQLLLIAQSLAEALGNSGHELRVAPRAHAEIERARSTAEYALMVDFVRTLGPNGPMTQVALLVAQDPELARKRPRLDAFDARAIASSLTLGVIGELWVNGAHAAELRDLSGWALGNVWRAPSGQLDR